MAFQAYVGAFRFAVAHLSRDFGAVLIMIMKLRPFVFAAPN